MKNRSAQIRQWMKEIREVATEVRIPGNDIKAANAFLSASAKNLAYMKFEESLRAKPRKVAAKSKK